MANNKILHVKGTHNSSLCGRPHVNMLDQEKHSIVLTVYTSHICKTCMSIYNRRMDMGLPINVLRALEEELEENGSIMFFSKRNSTISIEFSEGRWEIVTCENGQSKEDYSFVGSAKDALERSIKGKKYERRYKSDR